MPQKGLIRHDFFLFNGLDAYSEANKIPEDKLYYAENSRFEGGRWSSKHGYTVFQEFTGGSNVKGLMAYNTFPLGVQADYLVAAYDSNFERMDSSGVSTLIAATGWVGGDIPVAGTSYRGKLYVGNGSDTLGVINETTFSTVVDAPALRLVENWFEKLWGVDNAAPSSVQYTATATAATPSNIEDWTTVGASGAELIGAGGRVEALRKLGRKLYAFKNDHIEEFYDIDVTGNFPVPRHRPISEVRGAINQKSTVVVENDIWFFTPDLEIRSLGQEANYQVDPRVADISSALNRYKKDLDPDQSGAVAIYDEKKVFKLSLKSRGSSQNDLMFSYDFTPRGFSIDKASSPQNRAKVGAATYFSVGGSTGKIFKDNTGHSHDGSPMSFTGRTGLKDDGRQDLKKHARKLYVRGARSEGVVIEFKLVGEDYVVLETHTLAAPTAAEILAVATPVGGLGRAVGDIVGEEGYAGTEFGLPYVYRFNKDFSCGSNDRLFGCEVNTFLNGQRVFIDDIKLKYIPREEYISS